ncbi:MAG: hypothetical protein HIU83_14730 [Proteobacteria bacterium]|nr:hypothetical protein [Pseudomonadota bacterium]
MRLQTYGQHTELISDVMVESLLFAEKKLAYDSRYRDICAKLDAMIELIRQQPCRNLTVELDQLLEAMIRIIGTENHFMAVAGYPKKTIHHNHHYYMFVITDELNYRFRMGQNVLLGELTNLRLLWLIHIQIHDRAFEEFLTI